MGINDLMIELMICHPFLIIGARLFCNAVYNSIMSRNRYKLISKFPHFTDNHYF